MLVKKSLKVFTLSGRLLAAAISLIGKADVLVANIQCGGITCNDKICYHQKFIYLEELEISILFNINLLLQLLLGLCV